MVGGAVGRISAAASRVLGLAPALLVAVLGARIFEFALAMPPAGARAGSIGLALVLDGVALLRAWPLVFLLSLPALVVSAARSRRVAIGALWSVLVVLHVVLMQYFLTTGVPLGADLFGYSPGEVGKTLGAGAHVGLAAILHLALPLAGLWTTLWLLARRPWTPSGRVALASLAAGLVALIAAPGQGRIADALNAKGLVLDKTAYFFEDTAAWLTRPRTSTVVATTPEDARFPFLHREQTPDVLGPLFRDNGTPPNLVFVIVEGLGRSFSGPGAALGSFTPFLDELAGRSLYFENFLANQGRTFAALSTIFGSLPFGEKGFAGSADTRPLPAHVTLLSILGAQGYHVRYYAGFDLAFDNERPFLERQGAESLVDTHDFGDGYTRANSWGYADGDLMARTLADEGRGPPQPSVVTVQTVTMHTPYTFPGQAIYGARLEQRLDQLGIPAEDREAYRQQSNIYTSILYTDDALRVLVEGLARTPAWPHTILVVTGDHRLPELPMATRIERYHVPLIIHSPLLKAPASVKAVSSQMDLTPSLLAYLAHGYGLRSPAQVTWLGTGLDVDARFRNVHDIPLKLAKNMLADFVRGPWYFSRGQLFRLADGMTESPADDPGAASATGQALARFAAANDQFAATGALMPESALPEWEPYREEGRGVREASQEEKGGASALAVSALRVPTEAPAGALRIEADFTNSDGQLDRTFVPLIVLLDESGDEVSETYGKSLRLAPGSSIKVALAVKSENLKPGRYYLAVIPSDPATGKAVGTGRYHVAVRLR